MKSASFMEDLPCDLAEHEWQLRSSELGNKVRDLRRHQELTKQTAQTMKAAEEELTGDIDRLSDAVATRKEVRPVECSEVANDRVFEVATIRHDTGTVIRVRPMDLRERELARQGDLFDGDEEPPSRSANPSKETKH